MLSRLLRCLRQEIFPRDRINLPEQMKKREFNKLVLEKVQQILEGHEKTDETQ